MCLSCVWLALRCELRVYRLYTANGNEQLTQNWYGPGESDCLIKTKHCDGDNFVLTQCDFCPVL